MDKKIAGLVGDTVGKGEKIAPLNSIKLKVKFQKPDTAKKGIVKKAVKAHTGKGGPDGDSDADDMLGKYKNLKK